ncbi:MAG: spore germination protein [Dethiobacteria bacterium]|jgi:spore germination protein KA
MGIKKGILQKLASLLLRQGKKIITKFAGQNGGGVPALHDGLDLSQREAVFQDLPLSTRLESNLEMFRQVTGGSYDINIEQFLSGPEKVPAALLYVEGLVDVSMLDELLRAVKIDIFLTGLEDLQKKDILETTRQRLLNIIESQIAGDMAALYYGVSKGRAALLFDGTAQALILETQGWKTRAITEPASEPAIRGIREGFVEDIRTNTALIRRRIRSPNLWIEGQEIGSLGKTEVAFAYLKGLVAEDVLGELRSRLDNIDLDGVLGTGYIEEYITDNPYSLFPSILSTERVDRVAGALLEGRVAIFVDGSSFALVVPADFNLFLQAPDDYFEPFPLGTFIRFLRYVSFFIALFLPGVYVAILTFHPELLPVPLLLRIQAAREGVPFPVVAETFFMEAIFEILREAGVRLPMLVGPAISIVGALVLGDAAIRAGLVSPGVVVIVAFTAIASFTAPVFTLGLAARILRFIIIILGAAFGLLGIQFGLLLILIHLVTLRSLGQPYMAPFAPFIWEDMKDALFSLFRWQMVYRPKLLGYREPKRQRTGQKPHPPQKGDN